MKEIEVLPPSSIPSPTSSEACTDSCLGSCHLTPASDDTMGHSIDENNWLLGQHGHVEQPHTDQLAHLPSDPPSPTNSPYSTSSVITLVHIATNHWISKFGPIEAWPQWFQQELGCINKEWLPYSRQEQLNGFLRMIEDIAEEGGSLLTALRQMHPSLGLSVTDEWGYFIARGDMMDTLYRYIHMVEAWLDILFPQALWAAEGNSGFHWYSNLQCTCLWIKMHLVWHY